MTKIISFQEAIDESKSLERSLLMGNGFSIEHFSYRNLLDRSNIEDADPLKKMFSALNTFDFEVVIRALEDAALVERTYGDDSKSALFVEDSNRLREALVHAVREIHPANRDNISHKIPACAKFLQNFKTLFTFNYDLLLYWVQLDLSTIFKDGFGLGTDSNGFKGPFREDAYCNVYNLHGGLHLFKKPDGEIEKQLKGPTGVVDAIANTITHSKRLPIYVAEGSSTNKLAKINSTPYLRHAFQKITVIEGVLFVYGHSADTNDAHVYHKIFSSNGIKHLYFCIHQPTADINRIDGELARYKTLVKSKLNYTFVDAETVNVWGN